MNKHHFSLYFSSLSIDSLVVGDQVVPTERFPQSLSVSLSSCSWLTSEDICKDKQQQEATKGSRGRACGAWGGTPSDH